LKVEVNVRTILRKQNLEIGQVLPLVVLMMFSIIAMVALIIDGGMILSNRRTAQAAADAGALAGAQRACYGFNDAASVATNYAENNGATFVNLPLVTDSKVTVEATVTNESFFAKIFGINELSATATATSGCFSNRGKGVVPLAFHCQEGSIGDEHLNEHNYECIFTGLDWNTQLKPLLEGGTIQVDGKYYSKNGHNFVDNDGNPILSQIYIIMDTEKLCKPDGSLECDLTGDGKNEIKDGGERSWLYVDVNINSLVQYLVNTGPVTPITHFSHIWLSGNSGSMSSGYIKMKDDWEGNIVMVPIYNYYCDRNMGRNKDGEFNFPDDVAYCMQQAHKDPWPIEPADGDNFDHIRNDKGNYHIVTFAPFYISCISDKGECPGFQYVYKLNPDDVHKFDPVIEGYFVTDYWDLYLDSTSMCDIQVGTCIISLSE
jgi:type II secretory pathway pseudopilin PulG